MDACWIGVHMLWRNAYNVRPRELYLVIIVFFIRLWFVNCPAVICSPSMFIVLWRDTTSETMAPGPIFTHWYSLCLALFIIVCSLFHFHFHYFQPFDTFNSHVFSKTGRLTIFLESWGTGESLCFVCRSTLVDAPDNKQPSSSLRNPTGLITLVS